MNSSASKLDTYMQTVDTQRTYFIRVGMFGISYFWLEGIKRYCVILQVLTR
jgi:hypothetical protein